MQELAIVSIALGVFIMVSRGPMALAPTGTLRGYRWVVETRGRVRLLGVWLAAVGLALAFFARDAETGAVRALFHVGWLLATVALVLGFGFTHAFQRASRAVIEFSSTSVHPNLLRLTGAIALGVGSLFIWVGLSLF